MDARVVVVEDAPALLRSAVQALEIGGYVATGVVNLAEAVFVAAVTAPDVLVVDERVMRAAPDAFRALTRGEPLQSSRIVALGRVDARHELIEMGAHCVVGKPFNDRDLLVGIAWVLAVYPRCKDVPLGGPVDPASGAP